MAVNSRFQDMPDDILLEILSHAGVEDVLRLRQTCRTLECLSRSKLLWQNLLNAEIPARQFAWPDYLKAMHTLSDAEFEPLAVHLIRLNRHWHGKNRSPSFIELHRTRPVTWVRLIRDRWLVVAASDQCSSVLSIWEIKHLLARGKSQRRPVHEIFLEGPVVHGLLNLHTGAPVLALELRPASRPAVEIVQIRQDEDRIACVLLKRFENISRLRDMHGSILAFAVHNERSIPTILDWRTGSVSHLLPRPDIDGGAIAMKIEGDMIVVVSPRKLQSFLLQLDECGELQTNLVRTIPLQHSIGFVDLQIYRFTLHPESAVLYVAFSGDDGIFVYSIKATRLMSRADNNEEGLTHIWEHRWTSYYLPDPDGTHYDDPFNLLLGTSTPTLSWLSGARGYDRPVSFVTLSHELPEAKDVVQEAAASATLPAVYELNHPDMPALYARGVYAYDEVLGLIVFGNVFGELSIFNLVDADISRLETCFKPLTIPDVSRTNDVMSKVPVAFSSAPQFLFSLPPDLPEKYKQDLVSRWRLVQPRELPPGWNWEATDVDVKWPSNLCISPDNWQNYVATFQCGEADIAWTLEYARHFYGDPVPLVRNNFARIFASGGLLFVWDPEGGQLFVAHHGVTLEQLMEAYDRGFGVPPVLLRDVVILAEMVGHRYHNMWDWERDEHGRNRWKELEKRGGVVDVAWTSDKLEPFRW